MSSTQNGLRPSFDAACEPSQAKGLFDHCAQLLQEKAPTQTGVFGTHMLVSLVNDGPVTFML